MDAKETADIVGTFGLDFAGWFLGVLEGRLEADALKYTKQKRFVFLVFCTLIGATLGSLIPGRPPISERAIVAVTVVALWVFTSIFIHLVCRILRGKGKLDETVLAMLQILAIAYVVSTFLAMIVVFVETTAPRLTTLVSATGLKTPGDIVLFLQFVVLLIYTPVVLKGVHRFQGMFIGLLAGLLAATIAVLLASPVAATGHC
jgi:hypothetical protein